MVPEVSTVLNRMRGGEGVKTPVASILALSGAGLGASLVTLIAAGILIWFTWPVLVQAGRGLLTVGKAKAVHRITVGGDNGGTVR